ncbi:MAG: 7TM domain-containing protein [Candidatus Woesebacteria bacterium]|jgi:hypothetical protein
MPIKNKFTILFINFIIASIALINSSKIQAQITDIEVIRAAEDLSVSAAEGSTPSAEATESSKLSSPSAEVVEKIQKKKDEDITDPSSQQQSNLVQYLEQHPIGKLTWHNFLQHAIRNSIEKGLPANIIVLLILFPTIASIIAASRHIIGLRGFGIYIPAVLSVAFVSTGIITGTSIFLAVLLAATLSRKIIKKFKMPYLPRTAMLLWGVSIIILAILIISSNFDKFSLLTLNIFPLLIIMLLTENFMETQLFTSQREAFTLTLETLLIAILCSLIIGMEEIRQFVILKPELTLIGVAVINYIISKYTGLRLLEYIRFGSLLNKKYD